MRCSAARRAELGAKRVPHVHVAGGGGRKDEGVVDDGDLFGWNRVFARQRIAGLATVGDDVADGTERANEDRGQLPAGAHRGDDGDGGKFALEIAGVAVGHASHAENDIRREALHFRREPRGEPIQPQIERLQGAVRDVAGNCGYERTAGTKRQQHGRMARGGEGVRQQDGLSFRSAATQKILNNENFHCPGRVREEGMRLT